MGKYYTESLHDIENAMCHIRLVLVLTMLMLCGGCTSNSFTGSQHTVILRSDDDLKSHESYSLVRASDWQSQRLRGTPLGRAEADTKNAALRFTLPVPENLTVDQSVCLMIVGPRGPVAVRPRASGQAQYEFRNPLWEEEVRRVASLRRAESEARQRHADVQAVRSSMDAALRTLAGSAARSPEDCREGAPGPTPERPLNALPEPERERTAAMVCALTWEGTLGPGVGKLYGKIRKSQVWENRHKEDARSQQLEVELPSLNIVPKAVLDGEKLIEYDDAIVEFRQVTNQCESDVVKHFDNETRQWEAHIAAIQAEPRRTFERCREQTATYQEAKLKLAGIETILQQADKVVDRLRSQVPTHIETKSLESFTCQ